MCVCVCVCVTVCACMYIHTLILFTHAFPLPVAGVPASILLPPELFNEVPDDMPHIGVYFALYGDPVLLPVSNSTTIRENVTTFVGTPIVAATVGPGIDFGDIVPLDPPVTITLGLLAQSKNATVIN